MQWRGATYQAAAPDGSIVTIATPDQRPIGRLMLDVVHAIAGITRTISCLVIAEGRSEPQYVPRGRRAAGEVHDEPQD